MAHTQISNVSFIYYKIENETTWDKKDSVCKLRCTILRNKESLMKTDTYFLVSFPDPFSHQKHYQGMVSENIHSNKYY